MRTSLSWIEWLDRLDRLLTSAREDVLALLRSTNPKTLAAVVRSRRQLSALTRELGLLDPRVLSGNPSAATADLAANLKAALETAISQLGTAGDWQSQSLPPDRDGMLASIDTALRDVSTEAALLLAPHQRSA
jgi:hypothetical protein